MRPVLAWLRDVLCHDTVCRVLGHDVAQRIDIVGEWHSEVTYCRRCRFIRLVERHRRVPT